MAPTQSEQTDVTKPSAKDIGEAIACVFCFNTVDANLVQGLIANEISKAHPQLAPYMEAAKQLLPLPVKDELLSAKECCQAVYQTHWKAVE